MGGWQGVVGRWYDSGAGGGVAEQVSEGEEGVSGACQSILLSQLFFLLFSFPCRQRRECRPPPSEATLPL